MTKKKYHDFRLIHPEVAKRNINFNSAIAGFQPGWLVDKDGIASHGYVFNHYITHRPIAITVV